MPNIMKKIDTKEEINNFDRYRIRKYKKRLKNIYATLVISVVFVLSIAFFSLFNISNSYVVDKTEKIININNFYEKFSDGILSYTTNEMSYRDKDFNVVWSNTYNFKNPFVNVSKDYGVLCDIQGNDIYIFNKDKVVSNFKSDKKIVSARTLINGDVSVFTKGDDSYYINIYNKNAELIIEVKSAINTIGIPTDVLLTKDLTKLFISYVHIDNGSYFSTVNCYEVNNSSNEEKLYKSYQYEEKVVAKLYMYEKDIFAISNDAIIKYDFNKDYNDTIKDIDNGSKNVFIDNGKIILLKDGTKNITFNLFDTDMNSLMSKDIEETYDSVVTFEDEIVYILGNKAVGYRFNGKKSFDIEFNDNIRQIIKLSSGNYLVLFDDKVQKIKLDIF